MSVLSRFEEGFLFYEFCLLMEESWKKMEPGRSDEFNMIRRLIKWE